MHCSQTPIWPGLLLARVTSLCRSFPAGHSDVIFFSMTFQVHLKTAFLSLCSWPRGLSLLACPSADTAVIPSPHTCSLGLTWPGPSTKSEGWRFWPASWSILAISWKGWPLYWQSLEFYLFDRTLETKVLGCERMLLTSENCWNRKVKRAHVTLTHVLRRHAKQRLSEIPEQILKLGYLNIYN